MEKNEDLSLCFRLRGWARPCGRCPDGPTRSADSDQKILLNFKQYFAPLQTAFLVPRFQREAPRMTLCEPSGSPLGLPLGPSWGPSGDLQESSSWGPLRRGPKVEQMRAGSIGPKIPRGPQSAINRSREGLGLIDLSVVALIQS